MKRVGTRNIFFFFNWSKPNITRNSLQSLPPFNIYWIKKYKNFPVLSFREGAENLLKAPRKLIIVFFSADLAGEY